jgi:hypothetical protein
MPDFLASLALFGIVVSIFLFSWNTVVSNQGDFSQSEGMRTEAYYTATFLVSTPGYPDGWNSSTVEIPGFASSDNIVEPEKLAEFRELSYEEQKILLQAPEYRLTFRNSTDLLELNDEPLDYGRDSSDADNIAVINRDVLINYPDGKQNAEMRYIVWN